jgi:hypothetical protein
LTNEAGQTTGLMGDRAARTGGHGAPVPGAKALGALGEELEAPTKAGAAPPRRGLPDEGGGASGPLLVRGEPPPGDGGEHHPSPEKGAAGSGARP